MVWFHGGGLTNGSKEIPEALKHNGLIIVGAGYRLSPKVKVEQCIDDAAAAVAWVYKNIDKYGGDTAQVYLAGASAGGYLVDLITLDKKWLAKYAIDPDRTAAVFSYSGQMISHYTYRAEKGIPPL